MCTRRFGHLIKFENLLNTQVEPENLHDKYIVKILKNEAVVGHVPREISRYCSFVLNSGGTMSASVWLALEKTMDWHYRVNIKYRDQDIFCQRKNTLSVKTS